MSVVKKHPKFGKIIQWEENGEHYWAPLIKVNIKKDSWEIIEDKVIETFKKMHEDFQELPDNPESILYMTSTIGFYGDEFFKAFNEDWNYPEYMKECDLNVVPHIFWDLNVILFKQAELRVIAGIIGDFLDDIQESIE